MRIGTGTIDGVGGAGADASVYTSSGLAAYNRTGRVWHNGRIRVDESSLTESRYSGARWASLMCHEMGHILGLAHPSSGVQNMSASNGSTYHTLQAGDLAGVRLLYPSGVGNDTRETAIDWGNLTETPTRTGTGNMIGGSDNPTYRKFRLTETRQVDITLSGLSANLNLFLESSTGLQLASSAGSGTGNETISMALAEGTYYINIDVADASSDISSIISAYSLLIAVSATIIIIDPIIDPPDPPTPPTPSATLTFDYEELDVASNHTITWVTNTSGGSGLLLSGDFFADGVARYLVRFRASAGNGSIQLQFNETDTRIGDSDGDNFSMAFRTTGLIRFSSFGDFVTLTPPITDTTETYNWTPSNSAEVVALLAVFEQDDDLSIRFQLPPPPPPPIGPLPSGLAFLGGTLYSIDTAGTLFRHENFNTAGTKSLTTLTNSGTALAGVWESLGVWNGNLYGVVGQQLRQITVVGDTFTVGASLGNLPPAGVQQPSRLLIADTNSNELYELDPDGADSQGDRLRALPSGLTFPVGMTVLNGRLLIADDSGDELYELDPDGADSQGDRLRALPSGLTAPEAMTVLNGRLLIADTTGDELYELDPDGADSQGDRLRALPSGLTAPGGMTVLNGRLLIADDSGDELYELDPDGADSQGDRLRVLPSGLTGPGGMTVLNGRLLIADTSGTAELYELDPDGADSQGEPPARLAQWPDPRPLGDDRF